MRKITLLLLPLLLQFQMISFADEGMWLPIFLKQLNEADMQSKGMKVSAEDIYSVNHSSMKDGVVLFGSGCTGAIVSNQGLLLTNNHCGFSQVQALSSLENNYLKNGFWAQKMEEELPCPGLSVTFIIRIEDVSEQILKELSSTLSETDRNAIIKNTAAELEKKAVEGTNYSASIKPFYNGNQFYLFVMEKFTDIRLVGTPPNSIGEFGGDTDNWMWPRHTGDFSMFRIYADKDQQPAAYSTANVPYQPRYFFPISLKGVQEGDFTLVYGFPGTTTQYISSFAIQNIVEVVDPTKIKIRTARLEIIDEAMRSGDKLRIQYAAKQRTIANGWKKWQGEIRGLDRMQTIANKQKEELAFKKWFTRQNKSEYAAILPDFEMAYSALKPLTKVSDYINEAAYGVEMIRYAKLMEKLVDLTNTNQSEEEISTEANRIINGAGGFFKNFDVATDKKLFVAMMQLYHNDIDQEMQPEELKEMYVKYKGDFAKYAEVLYSKSAFSDSSKVKALLTGFNKKKLKELTEDPAWKLANGFNQIYSLKTESELVRLSGIVNVLNRRYMAAQMEMQTEKKFYPDANLTLRVTYGNVKGYQPRDGVSYLYYTTLDGIIQKEDPTVEEFNVPDRLKILYSKKDYGEYAANGTVPVAFLATNHTTGGNSGSPIINATGELIGLNFDRVWEGTMSDIDFDPDECRNISLDIRYALFIVDKFGGCKRLIDEMKIVR